MADIDNTPIWVANELSTAGPHVRGVAGELTQHLQDLRSRLAPLAESWDSNAHAYFDELESLWNQAATRLFGTSGTVTATPGASPGETLAQEGVLGEIAHALDVTWANYVRTEQGNTYMWQTR